MNEQLLGDRPKSPYESRYEGESERVVLKKQLYSYTIKLKAKELATMAKNTHDQQVKLTVGRISLPNSS